MRILIFHGYLLRGTGSNMPFVLLRIRSKRQCGRAAEKRNELAPPQIEHATIS
jgi:hypothetical protein